MLEASRGQAHRAGGHFEIPTTASGAHFKTGFKQAQAEVTLLEAMSSGGRNNVLPVSTLHVVVPDRLAVTFSQHRDVIHIRARMMRQCWKSRPNRKDYKQDENGKPSKARSNERAH